jgi:hypothetical protein
VPCEKALDEEFSKKSLFLCRVLFGKALGKEFSIKIVVFAKCPTERHLAKNFYFFFAECPAGKHSAKNFQKKYFLCRVPCWMALDKATVNGGIAVTVTFLCRVRPLSINLLPSGFCRVQHSAKPLPSAIRLLPSV